MLSISVFLLLLLLVCWKGVRGGLSQLIYHIKYQPSSTFYLTLYPPFTRPPSFLIPPLHLPLFSSLLSVLSTSFFIACLPRAPVPLPSPHTSP